MGMEESVSRRTGFSLFNGLEGAGKRLLQQLCRRVASVALSAGARLRMRYSLASFGGARAGAQL